MAIFIGIDPGVGGAVAFLDGPSARLHDVIDMPTVENGPRGRRRINAAFLRKAMPLMLGEDAIAIVEDVGPMPREGAVGAFSFGRGVGVIEGVLTGVGISVRWVKPQDWKRRLRFPKGASKDYARGRAAEMWPGSASLFARKKDDGRAEAALIAFAGSMGDF